MKKSPEQLELEKLWKDVFISAVSGGNNVIGPEDAADFAVKEFKKRFPPAITPIKDNSPD